jgi:anti-anti-sigma factor
MTITSTHVGDAVVLRVEGRLDAATSPEFEKAFQQSINSECRRMIVDLEGVDYVSSAGLRVILVAAKTVRAGGGVLGLSGLRRTVKDTLEMAGFCALFPIYDSLEKALESH